MSVLLISSGRTPSLCQTSKLLHEFPCEHHLFLFTSNSTVILWTSSVLIYAKHNSFPVNVICSYLRQTQQFSCECQTVLYMPNSAVLIRQTHTVLIYVVVNCSYTSNLNCSYLCSTQLFFTSWTQLFFIRGTQLFSICRTQLYPVSRVCTTLSTLDSALLCNPEIPLRILILWLWAA